MMTEDQTLSCLYIQNIFILHRICFSLNNVIKVKYKQNCNLKYVCSNILLVLYI